MKLFRRNIDPRCAYCQFAATLSERDCMCVKRGVVPVEHHCRKFRYDPLKRVPARPQSAPLAQHDPEEFKL